MEHKDAPTLDSDFSKFIIMNGLPKCDEKKADKLKALLVKLFNKKNFPITEECIEHNFGEDKMTTGQCFIQMKSDEHAKIAAALFNGHKLDSKHTFSACTFPEFEKIMATAEELEKSGEQQKTDFLELKSFVLETRQDQFAFQ